MKINIVNISSWLLIITLPFANITKLIGIEDGFSRVTIALLMFFLSINFCQKLKINFTFLSYVFFILISTMILNIALDNIVFIDGLFNIFKTIVFIFLIDILDRNDHILHHFLTRYYQVYLFSLFISLVIYLLFPMPEFVFYDGSENRFGGLHFELYNFMFSTILFYVSWLYNGRNNFFGFILMLVLMLFARSNIFFLYMLLFILIYLFRGFLKKKYFTSLIIISIVLSPLLIGLFLDYLGILNQLSVRSVSSFDSNGSALYIRLYPFALAAQHILESGWAALLPMGLGYFENSELVINDPLSYGGTGSPKAVIDLGIIIFLFVTVFIAKKFHQNISGLTDDAQIIYSILFFPCLIYISFGAGFLNIVAWFCILASVNFLSNFFFNIRTRV